MNQRHPLPVNTQAWLTNHGFQVMGPANHALRATRPWPGQPDYMIEVSVGGDANSPITVVRSQPAGRSRGRSAHVGIAVEVSRGADAAMLEAAYQYFLGLNRDARTDLAGLHKFPVEQGRPAAPAVKPKR